MPDFGRVGADLAQYLRQEMMPSMWCPGCGHGQIARGIAAALAQLGLAENEVVLIGGIGCSGRTPFYFNTNAMHTTHGRALAFATGLKLANPRLKIIVAMGDGDGLAIGAGHFIHAARRNIDLTVVLYNNNIYGMTGGQESPATPLGFHTTTSLKGSIEPPFDAVDLLLAAGATYVARTTTFDFQEMPRYIAEAIAHPGFAMVEVLTQCPTFFGRLNRLGEAPALMDYERDHTVPLDHPPEIRREDVVGALPVGVFRNEVRPEYVAEYRAMSRAQGGHYDA